MAKPKLKPRNPLVALVRLRKAGPHGQSAKALRREARMALLGQVMRGSNCDEGFCTAALAQPCNANALHQKARHV